MSERRKRWFGYLPPTPRALRWGLHVLSCGYTEIPPGVPYPPEKHPEGHHFTWEHGRTLDAFTLVYITRGRGELESSAAGHLTLGGGDLFVVFPDEWHRYRPLLSAGWDEHWVEFDGEQARRMMAIAGVTPDAPVVRVGEDADILRLFLEIAAATESQPAGFEQIIAAQTSHIIARVLAHFDRGERTDPAEAGRVRKARFHILGHATEEIDFAQLAQSLGTSYSSFRRAFKRSTGMPPAHYQMQIRLKRARLLLRGTLLSIGEIAEAAGFESVFYFSRLFKKKSGLSPAAYRKRFLAPFPSRRTRR